MKIAIRSHMAKNYFLLLFILFRGSLFSQQAPLPGLSPRPDLVFDSDTIDFGKLNKGQSGHFTISYVNKGSSFLKVSTVKSSDVNLNPEVVKPKPQDSLGPNRRGFIPVELNTTKQGSYAATVSIYSNAPGSPAMVFVKWEVLATSGAVLKLDGDTVEYGIVEYGATGIRKKKFTNSGDEPLIIYQVQSSCGCLYGEWPKQPILPGKSDFITIHYDTKRPGMFSKDLTITSNSVIGHTKRLPVMGVVIGFPPDQMKADSLSPVLFIANKKIQLGQIDFGAKKTTKLEFKNTGKRPLKIVSVTDARGRSIETTGSTSPWPANEIQPGETGVILIKHKTDRAGAFEEGFIIYSNAVQLPTVVYFFGECH
jgi:hypothetical protein